MSAGAWDLRALFLEMVHTAKYRRRAESVTDIDCVSVADGWQVRAWTDRGAVARVFVAFRDAEHAMRHSKAACLELAQRHLDLLLTLLSPPRVPFRIGLRHPRRLQIARAA